MAKLRLFVRVRKQGARIESVPLKQLVKMSLRSMQGRHWYFEGGWLILEC